MKTNALGRTGIVVTELCAGTLPLGPLQKNCTVDEGAALIAAQLRGGVNFIDTAQLYLTYPHIRRALELTGSRPVIATKSGKAEYAGMAAAVAEARDALGVACLDIVHLHAARMGPDLCEVRAGALQCLKECRKRGEVRAIGVSTHDVRTVRMAAEHPDIDVVFPLYNAAGLGMLNGDAAAMRDAIALALANGKGVYLMKVVGGGQLLGRYREVVEDARALGTASLALGAVTEAEALFNVAYFAGTLPADAVFPKASDKTYQAIGFLCNNCGTCRTTCGSAAISERDGKACIDAAKCVRCGYCVPACPQFAIRVT